PKSNSKCSRPGPASKDCVQAAVGWRASNERARSHGPRNRDDADSANPDCSKSRRVKEGIHVPHQEIEMNPTPWLEVSKPATPGTSHYKAETRGVVFFTCALRWRPNARSQIGLPIPRTRPWPACPQDRCTA